MIHLFCPETSLKAVIDPVGLRLLSLRRGEKEWAPVQGMVVGPRFASRYQPLIDQLAASYPAFYSSGKEPWEHGIAGYATWDVEQDETSFRAVLKGKMEWNGVPLAKLEGQDFTYHAKGALCPSGFRLDLSIVSEEDSVIGIAYLFPPLGQIECAVSHKYFVEGIGHARGTSGGRIWEEPPVETAAFLPYPNPLEYRILSPSIEFLIHSPNQENSWVFGKKQNDWLIVPLSSQNPWRPHLSVSSLSIQLNIVS